MRILIFLFLVILVLTSCKEQEARRPITRSSGSTINASIIRNKDLIKAEENRIKEFMQKDTLHTYIASNAGFWYCIFQNDSLVSNNTPKKGDLATFNYSLKTLTGNTLVTKEDAGIQITKIDQSNQEIIAGIRDGLKIMKEGESALLLLPSHKGYGYYGLEDKIPSNTILKCDITLLKIEEQ